MVYCEHCILVKVYCEVYTLLSLSRYYVFFFFNDTATTEIYTLSLHDALPICQSPLDFVLDRVRTSSQRISPALYQYDGDCG